MKILIEQAWKDYTATLGTGETLLDYFEKRSEFVNERQPFESFSIYGWSCRKNYPFFLAITKGNLPMVKYLVSKSFDINARNRDNQTPLLVAALYNHIEIVRYLLKMGADIDAKTEYNVTSLNMAALEGNKEMFNLLLKSGATVFHPEENSSDLITHSIDGENEETPLTYAVRANMTTIVKLLIEAASRVKAKDLKQACMEGNLEIVELLIEAGAVVDIECIKSAIEGNNLNCLKFLVEIGGRAVFTEDNSEEFRKLLEKTADIDMNSYLKCLQLV